MNIVIRVATDPLLTGILTTEANDPGADHVTYNFSDEELKAMQSENAPPGFAKAMHEYLIRHSSYLK